MDITFWMCVVAITLICIAAGITLNNQLGNIKPRRNTAGMLLAISVILVISCLFMWNNKSCDEYQVDEYIDGYIPVKCAGEYRVEKDWEIQ